MNLQDKKEGTLVAQLRNKLGSIVNYFQLLEEYDKCWDIEGYGNMEDIMRLLKEERKNCNVIIPQIVEIIKEMEKQENNQ